MHSFHIQTIPFTQTWDIRHRVMWPERDISYVQLEKDPEGTHLGLFSEETLVSVISFFQEKREIQFRKFATETNHQGKGFGSALLREAMIQMEQQPISRIWCNARLEKAHFYQRFGLSTTDQHFQKGGIPYVIMEKRLPGYKT